jgi:hypothetical protein
MIVQLQESQKFLTYVLISCQELNRSLRLLHTWSNVHYIFLVSAKGHIKAVLSDGSIMQIRAREQRKFLSPGYQLMKISLDYFQGLMMISKDETSCIDIEVTSDKHVY